MNIETIQFTPYSVWRISNGTFCSKDCIICMLINQGLNVSIDLEGSFPVYKPNDYFTLLPIN